MKVSRLGKKFTRDQECLRVNYSQDDGVVERGLTLIGEEVAKACGRSSAGVSAGQDS